MLLDFLSDADVYQSFFATLIAGQINVVVTRGDTRPICRWTIFDEDGVALDVSAATKSMTLYYRRSGYSPTLWKQLLTKTNGGADGLVEYRPGTLEPYLPTVPTGLQEPIRFHGELVYRDSVSGAEVHFRDALVVDAYGKFDEP